MQNVRYASSPNCFRNYVIKQGTRNKLNMSTSANVTEYTIRRNNKIVGNHSQHHLCKYSHHELLAFTPPSDFTIQASWTDEDEVEYDCDEMPLNDFLQPYLDMGRRYRDGCTMYEMFTAPVNQWGLPDAEAVKANRKAQVKI